MRRSKKIIAAGLAAGALSAMAAPPAARAVRQWETSRRDAWVQKATAALENGEETLPPMPWGVKLVEDGNIEKDDAGLRRLFNLIRNGNRTPECEHERLLIAAEEQRKFVQQLAQS